jgi:transcriptional regulator with XRE-family HTH domain
MECAMDAGISARHLSFIETSRSLPSRDMVLRLAESLQVPLRERNSLLLASGFAPIFQESPFDDPNLRVARRAIDAILSGLEPNPSHAFDRHWNLVAANQAALRLLDGVAPDLLTPPINVLRVAMHPKGLAPRIVNFREWQDFVLRRIERQFSGTGDARLQALLNELKSYSLEGTTHHEPESSSQILGGLIVRFRIKMGDRTLSFFSTTTIFGAPADVTLSELALETLFPADDCTSADLRTLAEHGRLP